MVAGKKKNITKNFTVETLGLFIQDNYPTATPNLNQVLTAGNTSLLNAEIQSLGLFDNSEGDYGLLTLSSNAFEVTEALGNTIFNIDNASFKMFKTSGGPYANIFFTGVANRNYQLPDASGTIALTSDIPTKTSDLINDGEDGINPFITAADIPVGTQDLDSVLTIGNTSLLDANIGSLGVWDPSNLGYLKITGGDNSFIFKRSDLATILTIEDGLIALQAGSIVGSISTAALTSSRTYGLPDASGTIALTSDIPVVTTPNLNQVLTAGNVSTLDAKINKLFLYDTFNSAYGFLYIYDNGYVGSNYTGAPIFQISRKNSRFSLWNSIGKAAMFNLGLSDDRFFDLPDASGTVALTSDILFTSLTTTGSSGPSTLLSGVLNVPNYTLSGLGGVPTSRSLTINGTTYDLTADRTWSVGTVTDVTATSPITSSGGTTPVISTSMATNKLIGRSTAGTGVMEEITVGTGLTLSAGTLSATSTGGSIPHATASGTDTYTATISGVASYVDGDAFLIRFPNGNTTVCTLNINALGAVPLYRNNDGQLIGGDIWDGGEMLCTYNSTLNVFQCIGTSPNSLFAYVTNADSVSITKGQPVYAFGGTGDRLTVKRAFNTSDAGSARTIGVVVTSSIATNQKGIIIIEGLLDGLSILPTATWSDGDTVYLGTTAGSITNVKQYAPNHLVYLGTVTTASNGAAGRWYVRVQNGYELDELHNVQAQTPTLKDTLWYDNTVSPAQWKTASISTILGYTPVTNARTISTTTPLQGGGDLTANRTLSILQSSAIQDGYLSSTDWSTFNGKFNLPSLTSGSVLFSNGTTIAQDNANFFWDDSNNRLGIGTATPNYPLHVKGDILVEGASGTETIWMSGGSAVRYTGGYLQLQNSIYINSVNSFVGIGLAIPSTALDVNGVITATGGNSTSWNAKQDAITGAATTITTLDLTASRVLVSDASGKVAANAVTTTTLSYLDATSSIQTQLNAKQGTLTLTTTGTSGPATLIADTLNIPQYGGGSSVSPIDIQLFLASGVWTKPAGAVMVDVYLVGAGGGGGSGRRGTTLTARYGGGGGASGTISAAKMDASSLGATENVWIGAGGNGAIAVTTNDTSGNTGSQGVPSYFGGTGSAATSIVSTNAGFGGTGGTAVSNSSNSGNNSYLFCLPVTNTYSSFTFNSNGFGGTVLQLQKPLSHGGFGGGISTVDAINSGTSIRLTGGNTSQIITTVNGGSSSGGAGNAGSLITNNASNLFFASGGSGGGSGNAAGTIAGGVGGAGGPGAGGGGGGASANGANSGAGGKGGDGFCMIITYF
jgi:hypothetical protein